MLQVGGIGSCTVTVNNAEGAYKIWGASIPRFNDSTVRETGHCKLQSLVKVPKELLQLQQKVCIGMDIFFFN